MQLLREQQGLQIHTGLKCYANPSSHHWQYFLAKICSLHVSHHEHATFVKALRQVIGTQILSSFKAVDQ
jgi:hypothetical protein